MHTSTFSYTYQQDRLVEIHQAYGKGGSGRKICYEYTHQYLTQAQAFDLYFYFLSLPDQFTSYEYNASGLLNSKTLFSDESSPQLIWRWTYDEQSRMKTFTIYKGEDSLIGATHYHYACLDEQNDQLYNLQLRLGSEQEALGSTRTYYAPDDFQHPVQICTYDQQEALVNLTSFVYNLSGQLVQISEFDGHESCLGRMQFFYDRFARLVQVEFDYQDTDLLSERLKSYLDLPLDAL